MKARYLMASAIVPLLLPLVSAQPAAAHFNPTARSNREVVDSLRGVIRADYHAVIFDDERTGTQLADNRVVAQS